jgi:ribonuclease HI
MLTEIWVDGAFLNKTTPTWAIMVQQDGITVHTSSGKVTDPKLAQYHQVTGELTAVMRAMHWCTSHKITEVTIHYDYEGIKSWPTRAWKAKNEFTLEYAEYMQQIMDNIKINFNKIKAHSGDAGNTIVDKMAKDFN